MSNRRITTADRSRECREDERDHRFDQFGNRSERTPGPGETAGGEPPRRSYLAVPNCKTPRSSAPSIRPPALRGARRFLEQPFQYRRPQRPVPRPQGRRRARRHPPACPRQFRDLLGASAKSPQCSIISITSRIPPRAKCPQRTAPPPAIRAANSRRARANRR